MTKKVKYKLIKNDSEPYNRNACLEDIFVKIFLSCVFTIVVVFYKVVDFNVIKTIELSENLRFAALTATKTKVIDLTDLSALNKTQQYHVRTKYCSIPYVDPFTVGVRKIYRRPKAADCTQDNALIDPVYDVNAQQYLLHINETVQESFLKPGDSVKCCYSEILRSGSGGNVDKKFKLLQCIKFEQDFIVPKHIDGIIVECKSNRTGKLLQKDAFSFIQYQRQNETVQAKSSNHKPNVLLIGIDTVSSINFRRTMPKTFAYVKENHWFELEGYNKVGDNTYPNLMPLLSGFGAKSSYGKCNAYKVNGLDKCDFIWKNYKNAGYHTAFAEDEVRLSTFNYLKKGFAKPPTDHYLRPFLLAIEKSLKVKNKFSLPFCVGRRQYGEYVYDYALEFTKRYSDEPHFGLFWTNSFSHDSYIAPATMDAKMKQYLLKLEQNGVFRTSIVIFFSDHGARWGPLLKQPEGFLEERLPMFFIWLPHWFRNKYPSYVQALDINRHRLTSPFDIHMTLKHILSLNTLEVDPILLTPPQECPKCHSIFYEVFINRTCDDAGISEHWCTCIQYQKLRRDQNIVKNVTNLVIDEINHFLVGKNLSNSCRKLSLKSIDLAEKEINSEEDDSLNNAFDDSFRVKFSINEKEAQFQATAVHHKSNNSLTFNIETDISRLNLYANDSYCIEQKEAKKFCICEKKKKKT